MKTLSMIREMHPPLIPDCTDGQPALITSSGKKDKDPEYIRQLIRRLGELVGRALAEQSPPTDRDEQSIAGIG
jgi:hypothetical protein